MERTIEEAVEGEIGLVIEYRPGEAKALDVLGGAMSLIASLDTLDSTLLSSISTELEPVSILNDVQHSSLKILLKRVLLSVPDGHLRDMDWKKWLGALLVKGKHLLLQQLDADAPEIENTLRELQTDYRSAPGRLIGYEPPKVRDVQEALRGVARARTTLDVPRVVIQTELGDVSLHANAPEPALPVDGEVVRTLTNRGREQFKVRYPDLLGQAQWTVLRGGRPTRIEILHNAWLDGFHARKNSILPGDSLDCSFEESVSYDAHGNEVERKISVIEVHGVISPPTPPTQLRMVPDLRE